MKWNHLKHFFSLMVLAAAFALILSSGPAFALNPQPLPPGLYFGPFTLQPGQTARISVTNLGSILTDEPPDPCVVLVMLVDQGGHILNEKGQGQTLTIGPGSAADVEYSATSLTHAGPVKVRGVVLSLTPLPQSCSGSKAFAQPPCNHWVFQASLEILDSSTGQTLLMLNPFERLMLNSQPLPLK